jgi:hypothetical protein
MRVVEKSIENEGMALAIDGFVGAASINKLIPSDSMRNRNDGAVNNSHQALRSVSCRRRAVIDKEGMSKAKLKVMLKDDSAKFKVFAPLVSAIAPNILRTIDMRKQIKLKSQYCLRVALPLKSA